MSYPGGKSAPGVYQTLINQMPPHDVYIEPFLGGGAVMRRKRPAALNIGVDLDGRAISLNRRALADLGASSNVANAAGVGRHRRKERWDPLAVGGGGSTLVGFGAGGLPGGAEFQLLRGDGVEFLRKMISARFKQSRVLVYCDPPYLLSTRTGGRIYDHEMTDEQHADFLDVIVSLPWAVMVSGYWSKLYARKLRGWRCFDYSAIVRSGDRARETVWCNFPEPVELHDYSFLGDDFRQRERIKRKRLRWVARLRRLDLLERRSLLAAIREAWGDL